LVLLSGSESDIPFLIEPLTYLLVLIGVGDGGQQGRSPPRFQVGGRKYLSAPQVLSLKNTNKEALSTPQPLSSNYYE